MEESKSILVKVPMETYRRMKKVQTQRLLEALRHKGDKKIRLDLMVLEAIEEMYPERLSSQSDMTRLISSIDGPLTQELLKSQVFLDPDDNEFYWLVDRGTAKKGMACGTLKANGQKYIGIGRHEYSVENLRELYLNGKLLPKKKSLPREVTYIPRLRKFKAVFYIKGVKKSKYLGLHKTETEAIKILKQFEKEFHGEDARAA
jgi:hypothetical protein